jgi:fluoroacetyl-CoA thioesterase
MKETLKAGLKHQFIYHVPDNKTVPHIYRESLEMQVMPRVFATGYMIALMEWTCVKLIAPHLDEGEGSLGVAVDVSHLAATPSGFAVTVDSELIERDGRRLWFKVRAHDGVDLIGEGRHGRAVVEWARFNRRIAEKAARHNAVEGASIAPATEASHG